VFFAVLLRTAMIEAMFLAGFLDFSLEQSAFQRTMIFHVGFVLL
jgi:hypothetical protein